MSKSLDELNKFNERCKEEYIRKVERHKNIKKNFIPKQKVKDVLQNNRNELFSTTYIDDKQYKPYAMQIDRINKIENELLEDK